MIHSLPYAANCSLLFTELPLLERPAAAGAAGFEAIEFWWPWPHEPVPDAAEVDAFVEAVREADVRLIGLNFFAGDLSGPDCGVISIPDRSEQFVANLDVAVGIGRDLAVTAFNALYGNRVEGVEPQVQDDLAVENLRLAADAVAPLGATVLVEPVSGPKPYPLRTAGDVLAVLDRVRRPNIGLLLDLFHLTNNGDDLEAIQEYADRVAHVQVADHPGRGEPGSGRIELERHLTRLRDAGYRGYAALEYVPTTTTLDSLAWLRGEDSN